MVADALIAESGLPTTTGGRTAHRVESRRRRLPSLTLIAAWAVVAVVIAWTVAPGLLAPYSAYEPVTQGLQAPSWQHWFGTDQLGRDQLSRVIVGARESLLGAGIAVTIGLTVGVLLGAVAGALGGVADGVIMRIVDVLLAVPGLLLALSVVVLLGTGTVNTAIAVGIGSIAGFARLLRSEVVQVRRTEYVEAAYGSGATFFAVLRRHVLPNSLTPIVALAALQFGTAILAISTLGFLGYGAPPPTPEWGLLIAEGRNYIGTAWWLTALPGLVVVAVVLSANRISHRLGRNTR